MNIRLDEWLKREFDPPPAIRTGRVWANSGEIYLAPVEVGRSCYVEEGAMFSAGMRKLRIVHRVFGHDS